MKKDYWYPTAFSGWGEEERAAIARVVASNRFTMGEETEAFEEELARFNQRKYAVCVNSGSSANLIAVAAVLLADPYPDERIRKATVPALAWGTTYAPLVQHGFSLELVDCDDTWCARPEDYPPTQGDIHIACSILGNPAGLLEIEEDTTHVSGSTLINDDCEALGAIEGGRPTASFGTIATQSFFWSHQLGAIEGGACLTDDVDLFLKLRCLRDHGLTRHLNTNKQFQQVPITNFDEEYEFQLHGYNARPVEMHMAIAREQLKKVSTARSNRLLNFADFAILTDGVAIKLPHLAVGANPFGIHFELVEAERRVVLAAALRSGGVDCRLPTGGSYHLHPYGRGCVDQPTPRADRIHRAGMFIGNAPFAIPEQIEKAAKIIKETL